jgi:hypothetical protein
MFIKTGFLNSSPQSTTVVYEQYVMMIHLKNFHNALQLIYHQWQPTLKNLQMQKCRKLRHFLNYFVSYIIFCFPVVA